jgi:hypothetical protein
MVRVPTSSQFLFYCSRLRLCILISLQKSRNTHMHTGHSVLSRASRAVGARGTFPDLVRLSSFLVSSLVFLSIHLHFANLASRSQLAVYALKPETVQAVAHKVASMSGSEEYAIPRRRISVSAFPIHFFLSFSLASTPMPVRLSSFSCAPSVLSGWFQYLPTITALCSVSHSPCSKPSPAT